MNEKVNDLLRRLSCSRTLSVTERALIWELRNTLQNECVVVSKQWITDNVNLSQTYPNEDGSLELTYEFRLRCLIHGYNDGTMPNDEDFVLRNYASQRIIGLMEKGDK
jgi:hypothetical protein